MIQVYTQRNETLVLFSEVQNSSCNTLVLGLLVLCILCSYPPTRFNYMGVKCCCEGEGPHAHKFAIEREERREGAMTKQRKRERTEGARIQVT